MTTVTPSVTRVTHHKLEHGDGVDLMQDPFSSCATLLPPMKITGTGSKRSPITIDDSEDEVLQELVGESSFDSNTSSHNQLFMGGSRNKLPGHLIAVGHHPHADSDGKRPQKRKRVANDLQSGPAAGPSQTRHPLPNHPAPALVSKKAKKRRRRLERQAMEAEAHPSKQQTWANGFNHLLPDLMPSPMLQSWPTNGMGLDEPPFQAELAGPLPPYGVSPYAAHPQYATESHSASSSAWVASMARAAETPAQDGPAPWESYPFLAKWPDFLQPSPPPAPNSTQPPAASRPLPQKLAEPVQSPDPPPPPAPPPAPPPVQSIGMKPDQDASSKHGLYQIPPGAPSPAGNAAPYIPNPARTLVMEQLPRSHRTNDFVNSWSKSACGAYPVYVHVDPPAAKALIEFATAELARKAWSSPRLGAALVGLKTNQLKGRPREDLIKVWWYRVDGVGANAGVGEIEEGEIEGDAAEKEVEVPVKKETKKERKARLARDRQAKQKTLQLLKPKAPSTQTQPQSTVPLPETSIPKGSVTLPLHSLPPNPTLVSPTKHGSPYYPAMAIPPAVSHSLPHHRPAMRPPAHVGPPLLPQSALAAEWRPKHEHSRRPPMQTLQEYVTHQNTVAQNGSISSSIASSRSPSPAQLSPSFIRSQMATPTTRTASPDREDVEINDDMELESPQTGKRAHFDFSVPPAPMKNYAVSPTSVPLVPSAVLTAVSEDVEGTPDAAVAIYGDDTSITKTSNAVCPSGQPLLDPIPPRSASVTSSSLFGLPPLEPRAMRGAPKGPSYAKRSLLARQKELAERIAQSKMELGLVTRTAAVPAVSTIDASVPRAASPVPLPGGDHSDKQVMEDRLRSLVVKTQRNKVKPSVSTTPSTSTTTSDPPPISPALASPAPSPSPNATAVSAMHPSSTVSTLSSHSFSLDDLAVSFITETIETIKATPTPAPSASTVSPPPAPSTRSNPALATTTTSTALTQNTATAMKLELAAKQKRLEAQIAESKVLMAKLQQARTKQERESILAVMRERSRTTGNEDGGAATATAPAPASALTAASNNGIGNVKINTQVSQAQAQVVKKWPVSHEHAGVLIVSDDEEDDDSGVDDFRFSRP